MNISPIPLCADSLTHRETEYAVDAVINGHSRPYGYVNLLQRGMGNYARQQYALAVNSPHAAMHLVLLTLRIRPDEEVILPELADEFAPAAIRHAGAKPIFCDVDPRSLCISPEAAEKRLSERTRVIIVTHMYGQPCDMDAFSAMAKKHNIPLVEIAAGGIGAMWMGKPAGSFGLFSLFGMCPGDPVTAGGGAVLLGFDKNLMENAAKYALRREAGGSRLNFDYGMSNIQAAVAHGQMERISELLAKKQEIHAWYKQELEGLAGVSLPEAVTGSFHSRLMNVLRLEPGGPPPARLLDRLKRAHIKAELVPAPLSFRPPYTAQNNPAALRAASESVLLPSGRNLTREEVAYVCGVIKNTVRDIQGIPGLTGRLKYRSDLIDRITAIKQDGFKMPFTHEGKECALNAVTTAMALEPQVLDLCVRLREDNPHALLTGVQSARVDMENFMRRYAKKSWNFLLFFVEDGDGGIWGHVKK